MRVLASAALMALLASGPSAQAAELGQDLARDDQIREVLSEAVKEYRAGRYDQAAAQFSEAIGLDPDNELIYDFYLRVGPEGLLQMQQKRELVDVIDQVLGRARIYQADLRRDPEFHEQLIDKLSSNEEDRLVATYELVAAGPRAIPALMKRMHDTRQDEERVWVRIVLTRMGYRAVRPLIVALQAEDERLVNSVGALLTDIADARALPQLQHLAATHEKETVRRVAANAVAGIARAAGIDRVDEAPVLYFAEAMRYFRDGTEVRDEMVANEALMWRWNAEVGTLDYVEVPRYAWNELVAEQLLFEAGERYGNFMGFESVLTAVLAAQEVEVDLRAQLAKERVMPASHPDETAEAITARQAALEEMRDRILMSGPDHIAKAVNQAIVAERFNVATYLMRLMEDPWLADPESILPTREEGLVGDKPGSILVAALDHGEKTVRYQAATTLAQLDPALDFFGADKVMQLLTEAVGEWGMKVVLVVDPDYRYRNAAARELQAKGYIVVTAQDGFEAMVRLREAPIKDAIIIAGDLTPAVRDAHGEVIDVPEQTAPTLVSKIKSVARLGEVPIFVSLPEDPQLAVEIETVFNGKVEGFMGKPFSGSQMADAIDDALEDVELPEYNRDRREDVSLRATESLAAIDPKTTRYAIHQGPLLDALVATLVARSDAIRIAALEALGQFQAVQYAERIAEIYLDQDDELSVPLRIAFLYALGLLDADNDITKRVFGEALDHTDRSVRAAAAAAIGRARSLSTQIRHGYQVQKRLDARAAGNGLN